MAYHDLGCNGCWFNRPLTSACGTSLPNTRAAVLLRNSKDCGHGPQSSDHSAFAMCSLTFRCSGETDRSRRLQLTVATTPEETKLPACTRRGTFAHCS